MIATLSRNWWILLIRGIAAILFGVATLVSPGLALQTLIFLFAAYAIVDGVFAVINAFQNRQQNGWLWMLIEGIISILAGIGAILFPGITALTLLYIVAFWSIFTGVMEIILAIRIRREIDNEWWMILSGVLSIAFGVVLILFPGAGLLGLLTVFAVFMIVFGVLLILLAFRLRSWGGGQPTTPTRSAA